MAASTAWKPVPIIQHESSNAEIAGLEPALATLRKNLATFTGAVEGTSGRPVEVTADFKIVRGGAEPPEFHHKFTITLNRSGARSQTSRASDSAHQSTSPANKASSTPAKSINGQPVTSPRSPSRLVSQSTTDDVDTSAARPFKRPRLDQPNPSSQPPPSEPSEGQTPEHQPAAMQKFIKDWHTEWTSQGGWLFDNITKMNATLSTTKPATPHKPELVRMADLLQKMDAVQNVLGQSINSASASTMAEVSHVAKNLIPWLETCRKTSADKMQAREEKWRMSSANFRDQARRDREAAEKRIERRLEEQNELLVRIARASGVDAEELEGIDGEERNRESREESLGAQLTAELSMEASKASVNSRYDSNTGSVTVND